MLSDVAPFEKKDFFLHLTFVKLNSDSDVSLITKIMARDL
jgi:hypothetical protein